MVVPEAVRQRRRTEGKPVRSDEKGKPQPGGRLKFSFTAGRQGNRVMFCTIILVVILGTRQGYYILSRAMKQTFGSFSFSIFPRTGKGVCSSIPLRTLSTTWKKKRSQIVKASQHPDDPNYSHKKWTEQLLKELSPNLMSESITSRPSQNATRRILQILQNKIASPLTAPPLKIAVVGGTTVEGRGCDGSTSVTVPKDSIMGNPTYCAWPYRLEQFLNSLFDGQKVVRVVNMGEEGTETALMTPLLRNRIYPKMLLPHGPDVIINAYGAGDYMSSTTQTPHETIQMEMEAFVQAAKQSRGCGDQGVPPLIVNMDDSTLAAVLKEDVVFSLNYNDAISKINKWDKPDDSDVPFGMAGHVSLAWLLSYTFGEVALDYCRADEIVAPNDPSYVTETCGDSEGNDTDSCVFRFFAGPTGTVKKAHEITKYITPFIVENQGWNAATDMDAGWSRKAGLEANSMDAAISLQVESIQKEVTFVTIMVLRTNLPKYQKSVAKFTLYVNENKPGVDVREMSFEIEGYHDSPTHITYPVEVDLKDYKAAVGSDLRLRIEMVGGNAFKILGILFCS
eukprot:CAMPEP_0172512810 /NCGR_PEP_ID=MMETSP1066-20121228/247329_1 /TAXON_ID=671091 /ORGANISM="Coscinodiscus wailesii, Strain CCMP2513" /LENGTH=564 /DNA_ID=CAMNT_0013292769 /DNA_START=6 /DNA_END=1700 /DNA_ORIENTATION=+